nr:MAG TPA: hypothetical protein [Caudoviricetes sp.]
MVIRRWQQVTVYSIFSTERANGNYIAGSIRRKLNQ